MRILRAFHHSFFYAFKCAKELIVAFLMAVFLGHSFLLLCFLFPTFACSCFPISFSCGSFLLAIKPPFTTTAAKPRCGGSHLIKCDRNTPLIQFKSQGPWYHLINISNSKNILIVQDQLVGNPSWGSLCSFLCDAVKPIPIVNITRLSCILTSERAFFDCTTLKHEFSHEFVLQFRHLIPCKDYNFYYTQKLDNRTLNALHANCSALRPPLFEWRLSFSEENSNLSLLSVGFSHQLELRHECFDCRVIENNCSINGAPRGSMCPAGKKHSKKIVIGVAAGGAVLLAACCLFLFLYRHQKSKQHSPSSLHLPTNSSEPSPKKDPELGSACYQTHTFSYTELEEATDGFDTAKELGDGGFGTVYKGELRDGRTVAVKRLYENNCKRVEQFMNEIVILSRLRHQNLVTLYGCSSRHSRELLLVYEFVPNGTVADHLHGSRVAEGALTWPIRMNIAIETAEALTYLHAIEPQIIHRDVKTNNILLDNNFHVKVADFGLSRLFPVNATHVSTAPQGTPGYVDPEYHQCYQLTDKSDVYSFGVVLVELISSKLAVDVNRHRHEINLANMAINKIQNRELDQLIDPGLGYELDWEVKSMTTQVAELAFRCLQWDRDMRPPIKEVLEVLRAIRSGRHTTEKAAESDASTRNDTPLLKDALPYSPHSVADNWVSTSTTSNTSS